MNMIWVYIPLGLITLYCIREAFAASRLRAALREFIGIMNDSEGVYLKRPVFGDAPPATVTWDLLKAEKQLNNYLKLTYGEIYEI
ncbi:MAG: hypothetical protein V3W20_11425 [Candidatus Neomarinimicrobiota bacterium]